MKYMRPLVILGMALQAVACIAQSDLLDREGLIAALRSNQYPDVKATYRQVTKIGLQSDVYQGTWYISRQSEVRYSNDASDSSKSGASSSRVDWWDNGIDWGVTIGRDRHGNRTIAQGSFSRTKARTLQRVVGPNCARYFNGSYLPDFLSESDFVLTDETDPRLGRIIRVTGRNSVLSFRLLLLRDKGFVISEASFESLDSSRQPFRQTATGYVYVGGAWFPTEVRWRVGSEWAEVFTAKYEVGRTETPTKNKLLIEGAAVINRDTNESFVFRSGQMASTSEGSSRDLKRRKGWIVVVGIAFSSLLLTFLLTRRALCSL